MAGRSKLAVLATLMFALLLSASLIEAARPIVSEGSNVAADGSVMVRDPHSRQLRTFFGGGYWPWNWFGGCGWFFWGGCNRGYVRTVFVGDDHKRKLSTFFGGWGWGGFGRWGGWGGWGGWGFPGYFNGFYGRR